MKNLNILRTNLKIPYKTILHILSFPTLNGSTIKKILIFSVSSLKTSLGFAVFTRQLIECERLIKG